MNYSCLNYFFWHDLINICLITLHNKSTHRMSVETVTQLYLHATNRLTTSWYSSSAFLTTWYTALFATKLYRVVQFWVRKLYLVVPFNRGTKILVSPDHFLMKYLVRGDLFCGDQLLRDSCHGHICPIPKGHRTKTRCLFWSYGLKRACLISS